MIAQLRYKSMGSGTESKMSKCNFAFKNLCVCNKQLLTALVCFSCFKNFCIFPFFNALTSPKFFFCESSRIIASRVLPKKSCLCYILVMRNCLYTM